MAPPIFNATCDQATYRPIRASDCSKNGSDTRSYISSEDNGNANLHRHHTSSGESHNNADYRSAAVHSCGQHDACGYSPYNTIICPATNILKNSLS